MMCGSPKSVPGLSRGTRGGNGGRGGPFVDARMSEKYFCLFRHVAPRNQHPRNRGSARRLLEIDPVGGFGGRLGAELGWVVQYMYALPKERPFLSTPPSCGNTEPRSSASR